MKKNKKYKITLAYDGAKYCGWLVQPNSISIQKTVQNALEQIFDEPIDVSGSSRTDARVHARGQTAHFSTTKEIPQNKIQYALNRLLPVEIRVIDIEEVDESFHARYSAKRKTYRYHIYLSPHQAPFERFYSYHIRRKLDIDEMKKGAKILEGTHDFTSFANQSHMGSCSINPVRTLHHIQILHDAPHLTIQFQGNGFLYKMVRNIVGTLLDVGTKKIPPERIKEILAAKDRKQAGQAAPAHGLFLMKVDYEKEASSMLSKEG